LGVSSEFHRRRRREEERTRSFDDGSRSHVLMISFSCYYAVSPTGCLTTYVGLQPLSLLSSGYSRIDPETYFRILPALIMSNSLEDPRSSSQTPERTSRSFSTPSIVRPFASLSLTSLHPLPSTTHLSQADSFSLLLSPSLTDIARRWCHWTAPKTLETNLRPDQLIGQIDPAMSKQLEADPDEEEERCRKAREALAHVDSVVNVGDFEVSFASSAFSSSFDKWSCV
jgi:hypothetical protein